MSKLIIASISMGDDHTTKVNGKTIEEVIDKIREYHTMGDFEREHYTKKGTIAKQLKSGWYLKDQVT